MAQPTGAKAPRKSGSTGWWVAGAAMAVILIFAVVELSHHGPTVDPLATYTTNAETQFAAFLQRYAVFGPGERVDDLLRNESPTFVAMPAGAPAPPTVPTPAQATADDEAVLAADVRQLPAERAQARADEFARSRPPDAMKDAHKLIATGLAKEATADAELAQFVARRQEPVLAHALADLGQAERDWVEGLRLAREALQQAE